MAMHSLAVRFGSKGDMCDKKPCSLYPKSRNVQRTSRCLLWAKSGHRPSLFDYLFGTIEQRRQDGDAKRFSGLEVDHKLELGRLLHWKFGWLGTFENPASIYPRLAISARDACRVTDQPAPRPVPANRKSPG